MNNEMTKADWGVDNMLEVRLKKEDDFLKVKETLTRMGIASKKKDEKILYQSCHILHKKQKYYIVHFKELFALDGKPTNISDNDIARRNTEADLLSQWGLVELIDEIEGDMVPVREIKIIPFKEKDEWELQPKYNIGNDKRG